MRASGSGRSRPPWHWLASVGAGIYLAGTRSFLRRRRHGLPPLVRVVVLIATIGLRSLRGVLEPRLRLVPRRLDDRLRRGDEPGPPAEDASLRALIGHG